MLCVNACKTECVSVAGAQFLAQAVLATMRGSHHCDPAGDICWFHNTQVWLLTCGISMTV